MSITTDKEWEFLRGYITKNINRNISDTGKERVKVEGLKWGDKYENNVQFRFVSKEISKTQRTLSH